MCLYLPKYHCELNPIERNWCHAKKVSRQYVNGSIVRLREVVPASLDAVSVDMMNKFFRTCRDYEIVLGDIRNLLYDYCNVMFYDYHDYHDRMLLYKINFNKIYFMFQAKKKQHI